jgi:hypothetical protein
VIVDKSVTKNVHMSPDSLVSNVINPIRMSLTIHLVGRMTLTGETEELG